MENHASPLMTLPQSKLVENTTKFIQSRIDSETLNKDWLCPQHLVWSLAPTKYHKSLNQYFPTETEVVGWCEGAVYLTSLGRPTDIGLQLGKACYSCSG